MGLDVEYLPLVLDSDSFWYTDVLAARRVTYDLLLRE